MCVRRKNQTVFGVMGDFSLFFVRTYNLCITSSPIFRSLLSVGSRWFLSTTYPYHLRISVESRTGLRGWTAGERFRLEPSLLERFSRVPPGEDNFFLVHSSSPSNRATQKKKPAGSFVRSFGSSRLTRTQTQTQTRPLSSSVCLHYYVLYNPNPFPPFPPKTQFLQENKYFFFRPRMWSQRAIC